MILLIAKYVKLIMKNKQSNIYKYESYYYRCGYKYIAGVDEVGRGSWAGPVVAAAVILPNNYRNPEIKDSKVLSFKKRNELAKLIKQVCVAYSISYVDAPRIDKINILNATKEAMMNAIKNLSIKPNCILVDAINLKIDQAKVVPIIKGDSKSISIAAASIIAKVYRDTYCQQIDKLYPQYGFAKNKCYGTLIHLNALKKYGYVPNIHRTSYKPVINALKKEKNTN